MRTKLKSPLIELNASLKVKMEIKMLNKILNWKTTVGGILIGIGQYVYATSDGDFSIEKLLTVIPTALLGLLASDSSDDKTS
jgi:hypothetical protein